MKKSYGEKILDVVIVLIMLFLSVLMLYPYLNQLAIAFNDGTDTMMGGVTFYPRKPTWTNFSAILDNKEIIGAMGVTVFSALTSTVLTLFVCVGAAYGIKKKDLPGRNFIIKYLMLPSYISAGVIPVFILYRYLGLMNNILVYILPGAFLFYYVIIIRSFLESIPGVLEEAAYIDGANEIQILFQVVLPLAKPILATIALWKLVAVWNDWTTTLYYVFNKKELYSLQYVIMQLVKQNEMLAKMTAESAMTGGVVRARPTSESLKAAAVIVSTVPIVMSYPFLQKYFIKGVTVGAVKE